MSFNIPLVSVEDGHSEDSDEPADKSNDDNTNNNRHGTATDS